MKRSAWILAIMAVVALGLLVVSCGGTPATTSPTTPAATTPAVTSTPTPTTTTPVTTTPATTTPATTTPVASAPPKAPKAMHEALYAATPPGCTTCHTAGGPGVGAAGGTGLPASHATRTNDTCKACHQLSS